MSEPGHNHLYGGIEAGGTKFACAVGSGPGQLTAETRFPTTGPAETLGRALDFFTDQIARQGELAAIGVASFGPVDLRPDSARYGFITSTPKEGWQGTDIVGEISRAIGVPIGFDTDVNGAALAEWQWGAARDVETFVYLTVGTGIGGGGMAGGRLLHGLIHPEMGHMLVPRRADDDFAGVCSMHSNCLEGLASGPAIEARWNRPATALGSVLEAAVALEAHYLGSALVNVIAVLSPQRIILGGGVMNLPSLIESTRSETQRLLGGYLEAGELSDQIEDYIAPPALGDRAGVLGALALAQRAAAAYED